MLVTQEIEELKITFNGQYTKTKELIFSGNSHNFRTLWIVKRTLSDKVGITLAKFDCVKAYETPIPCIEGWLWGNDRQKTYNKYNLDTWEIDGIFGRVDRIFKTKYTAQRYALYIKLFGFIHYEENDLPRNKILKTTIDPVKYYDNLKSNEDKKDD